jgi:hypothetical protein
MVLSGRQFDIAVNKTSLPDDFDIVFEIFEPALFGSGAKKVTHRFGGVPSDPMLENTALHFSSTVYHVTPPLSFRHLFGVSVRF